MTTYVLVGGAWLGGWCWQKVARQLRDDGHDVYPATLTGLGERVHLASPQVDLDTASTFAPGTSTKLKVLTAGQVTGSGFTRLQDPGLPNGREWYATYNPRDVTLGVRQV
jgi:hypothetical protein